MKLILKYLNRYKGLVLLNMLGVLGFALVELGIPTIMATVIDKGIAYNDISYIKRMGIVIVMHICARCYGFNTLRIYFSKDFHQCC